MIVASSYTCVCVEHNMVMVVVEQCTCKFCSIRLENNESNKLMLIRFIHTALELNSFICMKKPTPAEPTVGGMAADCTNSEASENMEVTSLGPPVSDGLAHPVPAGSLHRGRSSDCDGILQRR